jgi:acetoin:2,6-dichlorophenolindophenol oxidoreductase subunit alpha
VTNARSTDSPGEQQEVRLISDAEALAIYGLMATARIVEVRLSEVYGEGSLPGWIHSCEGHEAFGAAVSLCLRPTDHLVPHYRSRPEQLGKGMTVREIVAEVFATVDAASGGRGGETHVSSVANRIYGMTGVLGSNIPLAAGVAYASKVRQVDEVTLCTFGDGTANRGAFHEALNMAAIWGLPVVFVCENNMYAEMSKTSDFIGGGSIAERAAAYGMPGLVIDGHDPELVASILGDAVAAARGGSPSLIEAKMIRRRGHWEGDPQDYRPREEKSELDELDPVPTYRRRLCEERGVPEEDLLAIERAATVEVDAAIAWAREQPGLAVDDALAEVYGSAADV